MTINGLRLEYALEGTSNFVAWKDHMVVVLDENGLLEYIKTNVAKPPESEGHVAKVRRIILEGVHDHIISNIHGKESLFALWKTLT